jgi:hypothetical protein
MKYYHFKFSKPLSPEQEKCLYAGFKSFYYNVQDGLDKGIKIANNKLYRHASKMAARVTGMDGAQMSLDRINLIKSNLDGYIGWSRSEPGQYEFRMAVELFNAAIPTMGSRLDGKIISFFQDQIRPRLEFKKDEVEITTEVRV